MSAGKRPALCKQVKDFQRDRWMKIIKQEEEKPMFVFNIDHETAKHAFEERLRKAEHERLVQRVLANQPKPYARLRERLGDLLIAIGTNLKAHLPQELVEA